MQLGALEAEWGYPLFEFSVSGLPKYDLPARPQCYRLWHWPLTFLLVWHAGRLRATAIATFAAAATVITAHAPAPSHTAEVGNGVGGSRPQHWADPGVAVLGPHLSRTSTNCSAPAARLRSNRTLDPKTVRAREMNSCPSGGPTPLLP